MKDSKTGMKSVIFIHHSVGQNLINDGGLRLLANQTKNLTLTDYNQNTGVYTDAGGSTASLNFVFPDDDTSPADLARVFSQKAPANHKSIQKFALKYDVIVLKSCYPNSNIASDSELRNSKNNYQEIAHFFKKYPNKKLVIMTSPPLTPIMTRPARAKRARQLAGWLTGTKLGENVYVFDLFSLLASTRNSKQPNVLRRDYRRWLPFDSHPNTRASRNIAPKLIAFLDSIT